MLSCQSPWLWGSVQSVEEVTFMFRKHLFRTVLQVLLVKHGIVDRNKPRSIHLKKIPNRYFDSFHKYVRIALAILNTELITDGENYVNESELDLYVEKILKKGDIASRKIIHVQVGQLELLLEKYETHSFPILCLFWSLRALLGTVVENIILLDRFIYLMENSKNNNLDIALIPLFDHLKSPRNMVLCVRRKI